MRHRQRRGSARAKAPDRRTPVAVTSIGEGELSMHGTSWVRVLQAKPLRSLRRGAEHLATYLLLAEFSFRRGTFGMSCGWKQVKPAGRRQLDGRVREGLHNVTASRARVDLLPEVHQPRPRSTVQRCTEGPPGASWRTFGPRRTLIPSLPSVAASPSTGSTARTA